MSHSISPTAQTTTQEEVVRRRATWLAVGLGFAALAAALIWFGPEGLPRVLAVPVS